MSIKIPDVWVKLKFISAEHGEVNKILAGWYGGYTNGDSWQINSGIASEEEFEQYYEFKGHSGSIYRCYKECERFSNLTSAMFISIKDDIEKHNNANPDDQVSMELVKYRKEVV
jgi:hypothetical protein